MSEILQEQNIDIESGLQNEEVCSEVTRISLFIMEFF
jgi:hypothetical protein